MLFFEPELFSKSKTTSPLDPSKAFLMASTILTSLLGFEEHQQTLDEAQLRRLTERGAKAWRDVPSASDWVDSLRGGTA